MNDDVAIKVQDISKIFKDQASSTTLKNSFIELGRKILGRPSGTKKKGYTALKDINFEVKKGEFFGIVGRNGSGKSTLLKIIAGVYNPTKGAVSVNGTLTPFIELGVGFNPELSGRDNVYLNGALLGFTRKQMDEMYDDIVDFAELKDFMDMKLKNYSSGMQVRLAFSVAIRADSDILLIDEVLAVGDIDFQKKCLDYFEQLKSKKVTVCFVSHDMGSVERFCDRVLVVNKSKNVGIFDAREGSVLYKSLNLDKAAINRQDKSHKASLNISNINSNKLNSLVSKEPKIIELIINLNEKDIKNWHGDSFKVSFNIFNENGALITSENSSKEFDLKKGTNIFRAIINNFNINTGNYYLYAGLYSTNSNRKINYLYRNTKAIKFTVMKDGKNTTEGILRSEAIWEYR